MEAFHPNFASCSVESILCVPMRFIFRETQSGRGGAAAQKSHMFSKSEVSTLLRVAMLSSELDAILSLAYDALDRSQKCKAYRSYIEEANKQRDARGVMLRALLPILSVHSETAEAALNHVTCDTFGIGRVLNELESCADDLGKFAEQNHTMADQLDCYMAPGKNTNTLSDEKRKIAEIEEAVVERIENLGVLAMGANQNNGSEHDKNSSEGKEDFKSMSDLCEGLFPKSQAEEMATPEPTESQMFAAEALQVLHSNARRPSTSPDF